MKKIIFLVLFIVGAITASAQNNIVWNANAGIGMSNVTGVDDYDTSARLAFKVGVGMAYLFNETWSLQTGLNYVSQGSTGQIRFHEQYLQMPLMAGYTLPTASGFDLLFKAGTYFGIGIGGKTKIGSMETDDNTTDAAMDETEKDTFGGDGLRRFDFGLGIGVGIVYNKWTFGIDGQLGLVNLNKTDKPKNISAFATVAYRFW